MAATEALGPEQVVERFFAAFASGPDLAQRMVELRALFTPGATVVRTCGDLLRYDVEAFVAPREALLAGGSLVDFREWPVGGRLERFGDVAHWWGSYAKSGVQDGVGFTGRGAKSIQLVRTPQGWLISAVAWDDERPDD